MELTTVWCRVYIEITYATKSILMQRYMYMSIGKHTVIEYILQKRFTTRREWVFAAQMMTTYW